MKCYFCGDHVGATSDTMSGSVVERNIRLWNGRRAAACGQCHEYLMEYQAYVRNQPDVGGGESMKIERGNTGGDNLKVDFVLSNRISQLTIVDQGEMVTYEPKNVGDKPVTKLIVGIEYQGQKQGDPSKWSMNNKSRNALIDIFGDETSKWVGKKIDIAISGDGEYQHIVVDTLRTGK